MVALLAAAACRQEIEWPAEVDGDPALICRDDDPLSSLDVVFPGAIYGVMGACGHVVVPHNGGSWTLLDPGGEPQTPLRDNTDMRFSPNGRVVASRNLEGPNDHGTAARLLLRSPRPEIRPPQLPSLHPSSSRSNASAQSSRRSPASASSSSAWRARRSTSHRLGSGRRKTSTATRSPWRNASGFVGRSMPFSYRASIGRTSRV